MLTAKQKAEWVCRGGILKSFQAAVAAVALTLRIITTAGMALLEVAVEAHQAVEADMVAMAALAAAAAARDLLVGILGLVD